VQEKNIEIAGPLIFLKDSAKRGMYFMHGAYISIEYYYKDYCIKKIIN